MNKVLIFSPYSVASGLAGIHRVRMLAKYLPSFGWEPVVISVHERCHEQKLDADLGRSLPDRTRVIRTGAFPARFGRLFGIGDISIRGYYPMRSAAERLLKKERMDLLLFTVLPGFVMKMAPFLKKKYAVPFVLDYQDPWVSRWGLRQPWWSKSRLAHRIAERTEPGVIREAAHVTSVSAGTNEWLRSLYKDIPADRFSVLPIGADPDDFQAFEKAPCRWMEKEEGAFHLCYVGTIWPMVMPTIRAFFQACLHLKEKSPELYRRLRVTFVGSGGNIKAETPQDLEGHVLEIPEKLPYFEALNVMRNADALLLLGSEDAHYTASKLYLYLLSGKPILSIFHEQSSVCQIARETGGVLLVPFSGPEGVYKRVPEIGQALGRLIGNPTAVPSFRRERLEPYTAKAIAGRFAEIFDSMRKEPFR